MASEKSKAGPAPLVGAGLGRIAHDAFTAATAGKGDWDALVETDHPVAAAWCAAAQAVLTATFERKS